MTVATSILDPRATTAYPYRKNRASLRDVSLQAAAIMAALAIPTAAALLLDDRQLDGVSVWDKPLKFEVSLSVHLITLALLSSLLTTSSGEKRLVRWAYLASAFAAIGEILYIVLQAARGRASHFNNATTFEAVMYVMMGLGATILVVSAFLIGLAILRGGRPDSGGGVKAGAAWGLMLGAAGTIITAGFMSAGVFDAPGHWIGGVRSDAHGLRLSGWSSAGGDLRVPHFFATHLMQALPLLGLMADRLLPIQARRVVWAGAALGVIVVLLAFIEAALGIPLIRIA